MKKIILYIGAIIVLSVGIFLSYSLIKNATYESKAILPVKVFIEQNRIDFKDKELRNDLFGNVNLLKQGVKFNYPGIGYYFYLIEKQNLWLLFEINNPLNNPTELTIWLNNNIVELVKLRYGINKVKLLLPRSYQKEGINLITFITNNPKVKLILRKLLFNGAPINFSTRKAKIIVKDNVLWMQGRGEAVYYFIFPTDGFVEYSFIKNCKEGKLCLPQSNILINVMSDQINYDVKHNLYLSQNNYQKFLLNNDLLKGKIIKMRVKIKTDKRWFNESIGIKIESKYKLPKQSSSEKLIDYKNYNVLLIVLDAASAAHFKLYGYKRDTTPEIDKLARNSIVFNKAFTNAVFTRGSTASLFTSLYPDVHEVMNFQFTLSSNALTLAEIFKENNYITALFSSNGNVSQETGLQQGFDIYYPLFRTLPDEFTKEIINFISENKKNKLFIYAHYRHPHPPFDAPFDIRNKFNNTNLPTLIRNHEFTDNIYNSDVKPTAEDVKYIISQYDANLYYADQYVGELIDYLKSINLLEKTIIVITSDHGEAFGKHEVFGHIWDLHLEAIWIPLIVYLPKIQRSHSVNALIDTVDLAPTIIDLLALKNSSNLMQGKSFKNCFYNKYCTTKEFAYSQSISVKMTSLINDNFHIIYDSFLKKWEIYQYPVDKEEKNNLINSLPITTDYYKFHLLTLAKNNAYLRRVIKKMWKETTYKPSDEVLENLKSLGYLK